MRKLCQKGGNLKEAAALLAIVAELYMEDGAALNAAAVTKQDLKLDPARIGSHRFLAELYERLGLQADSATQYRLALGFYRVAEDAENAATMLEALGRLQSDLETRSAH